MTYRAACVKVALMVFQVWQMAQRKLPYHTDLFLHLAQCGLLCLAAAVQFQTRNIPSSIWNGWGLNTGPSACKGDALPLSNGPFSECLLRSIRKLPSTESDHWSLQLSIVDMDWQQLPRRFPAPTSWGLNGDLLHSSIVLQPFPICSAMLPPFCSPAIKDYSQILDFAGSMVPARIALTPQL